jgi:sterol desaturase/sphingolipid hydroxylase (fatty acid hydroxylase superfamily)
MFNHANISLPLWLDRIVRLFIVTPDMHRVHHSVYQSEHDSNYGFNLSLWDRLFGTYTAQPRDGHQAMTIGQKNHLDENPKKLLWSLMLPFIRTGSASAQKKLSGK